jgi:hypothetical protein
VNPVQQPYIVCPKCGMVSHNPNDVRERYCGRCHAFHDDPYFAKRRIATEAVEVIARFASIARSIMRRFMSAASCIAAARTTIEVMRMYGLHAVEIPTAYVFQVPARKYARIVGFSAEERAEMRAKSATWSDESPEGSGWNGHLIVLVEGRWLLDPSLDQVAAPQFGVPVSSEIFVVDTVGQDWNPTDQFRIKLGLILDSGDKAELMYQSTDDRSYLDTEAWSDEGLPLLAQAIAVEMESAGK